MEVGRVTSDTVLLSHRQSVHKITLPRSIRSYYACEVLERSNSLTPRVRFEVLDFQMFDGHDSTVIDGWGSVSERLAAAGAVFETNEIGRVRRREII